MSEFKIEFHEEKVKINPLLDGAVRKKLTELETAVNSFDGLNKNGIPDVQEIHDLAMAVVPKVMVALPKIAAMSECIDFNLLAAQLSSNPAIKDHVKLTKILAELGAMAEASGELIEKANALLLVPMAELQGDK